jgi:hypothetical protein
MALGAGATIAVVILCCGFFVVCLGAVGYFYRRTDKGEGVSHGWRPSNVQGEYMREVRRKNHEGMMHSARYHERDSRVVPSRSDFTSSSEGWYSKRSEVV